MDAEQIYKVLQEARLHDYIEVNHKRVLTDVLSSGDFSHTFYGPGENPALWAIAQLIATAPGADVQPESDTSAGDLQVHEINWVERYISKSGNVTWKAFDADGLLIYLRQVHREMLEAAGVWDALNAMPDGASREVDEAELHTVADGDFRKPVEIRGAWKFEAEKAKSPMGNLLANQRNAIEWAADLVDSGDFVVLDTETTGLPESNPHPVEIAVIDHNGNTLFNERVFPPDGVRIEPGAAKTHGITMQVLEGFGAQPFADVADKLTQVIAGKKVVIYNTGFDVPVLNRAYRAASKESPEFFGNCAMNQYAEYNGDWNDYRGNYRWVKLTEAASAMGVKVENAHSALGDCQMTLGIVKALAAKAQPVVEDEPF